MNKEQEVTDELLSERSLLREKISILSTNISISKDNGDNSDNRFLLIEQYVAMVDYYCALTERILFKKLDE